MKKLMFAAAAIAAGVATADVTSANIVGYASNNLTNGCVMITSQFRTIGANGKVNINDFNPTGSEIDQVEIQTLDRSGRTISYYDWNTWMYEGWEGWVDKNFEKVPNVEFAAGQGVWVQGTTENATKLCGSGEVALSDVIVALTNGCVGCGNPFPVDLKIDDIIPSGESIDQIEIQTLDRSGRTLAYYDWNTWMYEGWEGWVDKNFEKVPNVKFAPGCGLWVQGVTVTGTYIRMPAPDLDNKDE